MFNVTVNDKKNIYRSKPVMNVDTVPKPLTYDYMPEGYPSKSPGTVTLMEEQEVAFSERGGLMGAVSPVILDVKSGDKLTVVWDGISYNVVVKERVTPGPGGNMVEIMFGNLALINRGESEDYPFVYISVNSNTQWVTADTSPSHTIKVMRQQMKYTPIDAKFMPEGYPKKDGWSVEWDGNIDGKTSAVGAPLYKFSDRVLSYEEFLSAKLVNPSDSSQFIMVSAMRPKQEKVSDAISVFSAGDLQIYVISEDNAEVGGEGIIFPTKGLYTNEGALPFKLIKETITPMSTDFIPKNLNVVFTGIKQIGNQQVPTSCNVTYDELRRFADNDMPIFAIYKYDSYDGVPMCKIITDYRLKSAPVEGNTDMVFYYQESGNGKAFVYNSDGTISELLQT